jgi:hypothetical protein
VQHFIITHFCLYIIHASSYLLSEVTWPMKFRDGIGMGIDGVVRILHNVGASHVVGFVGTTTVRCEAGKYNNAT